MKKSMKSLRKACLFSFALILLCGFIYPLALTGVSQVLFPKQANGSLISMNDEAVASSIVGQNFNDTRFFQCRPSAYNYNTYTQAEKEDGTYSGMASGSNNYAPSNPALKERMEANIEAFLAANPDVT